MKDINNEWMTSKVKEICAEWTRKLGIEEESFIINKRGGDWKRNLDNER